MEGTLKKQSTNGYDDRSRHKLSTQINLYSVRSLKRHIKHISGTF